MNEEERLLEEVEKLKRERHEAWMHVTKNHERVEMRDAYIYHLQTLLIEADIPFESFIEFKVNKEDQENGN